MNLNTVKVTTRRMVENHELDTDGDGHYFAPLQPVTPVTSVTAPGQEGYTPNESVTLPVTPPTCEGYTGYIGYTGIEGALVVFDGKVPAPGKTRKTRPVVVTYNPAGFLPEGSPRPNVCCTQRKERHDDLAVWQVDEQDGSTTLTGHYCDRHRSEVEDRIGQRIEPPT